MPQPLRATSDNAVVTGWDFSTGSVKCLAFDLDGNTLAEVRMPTDLWYGRPEQILAGSDDVVGLSELNLMQLEGQARATVRAMAARLRELGRLDDWAAGGVSATHHTSGRIDADGLQVRRAICWNDHTLAKYHARGVKRLGGQSKVQELIGGPWAIRYSLSHLVKDEEHLDPADWKRTKWVLSHGSLAAGYLTGRFDAVSLSSAASTGIMHFKKRKWAPGMLKAIADEKFQRLAKKQLPTIIEQNEPVGPLAAHVALEAGIDPDRRPIVFPTSDDQAAGLIGGGAVDDGQIAVILGNSAVVNSSSSKPTPDGSKLDLMCLNWGPYLWMRCFNNGAQFLDQVLGENPDWAALEAAARKLPPGSDGAAILPFVAPEPSMNVTQQVLDAARGAVGGPRSQLLWIGGEPHSPGKRYRASLEALAFLIAAGVEEHVEARKKLGQEVGRISVSGGIARSDLMCEILATVINRPIQRLESEEGPALGAAVTALAALETHLRRRQDPEAEYTAADAVAQLVKMRGVVEPIDEWRDAYRSQLQEFQRRIGEMR